MKNLRPFLIRTVFTVIPLLLLYGFAEYSFVQSRKMEHRGDAGLGIAFLLTAILFILFAGYLIDIIVKFRKKQFSVMWIDVAFLIPVLVVILYFVCMIANPFCFCDFLKNSINKL